MALTKRTKRLIKRLCKRDCLASSDPLLRSLGERKRIRWDENGEGWREYGIEHMEDWSDEAVSGYFNSCQVVIRSDYDCTGRPFTQWIDWHRNPDGSVSYVHKLALDY